MVKHKHAAAINDVRLTGSTHHDYSPDKTLAHSEPICDRCGREVSVLLPCKGERICIECAIEGMEI